jgi:hypothetical protein
LLDNGTKNTITSMRVRTIGSKQDSGSIIKFSLQVKD